MGLLVGAAKSGGRIFGEGVRSGLLLHFGEGVSSVGRFFDFGEVDFGEVLGSGGVGQGEGDPSAGALMRGALVRGALVVVHL